MDVMTAVNLIGAVALSYLIGAIPTAYIFGRVLKGIDIRTQGSGNVGATNAFRVLGRGPGTAVLILDVLKGVAAVAVVAGFLAPYTNGRILAALAAVCGHNWTCFLNFKGGKGIATTLGVLIGFTVAIPEARMAVGLCVMVWLVSFAITAIVSLSSILAAVALPILMLVFDAPLALLLLSILFCVFVVLRHRPNIHRLLNGQEAQAPLPWHRKRQ
ncbi:MAG: glycerol-3-phosphate 1-O-acyltransferase PlsY [Candidatus Omnitrophota bacterium]